MKTTNLKQKVKGFTLVELVIVIAIVIILSVVSVPIYRGYTNNAKMSEGYALLGVILSAQKNYYSQYGNFLNAANSSAGGFEFTCNEDVLGIDARGNKYFTAFLVSKNDTTKYQFKAAVLKPEELKNDYSAINLFFNVTKGTSMREMNF